MVRRVSTGSVRGCSLPADGRRVRSCRPHACDRPADSPRPGAVPPGVRDTGYRGTTVPVITFPHANPPTGGGTILSTRIRGLTDRGRANYLARCASHGTCATERPRGDCQYRTALDPGRRARLGPDAASSRCSRSRSTPRSSTACPRPNVLDPHPVAAPRRRLRGRGAEGRRGPFPARDPLVLAERVPGGHRPVLPVAVRIRPAPS